MTDAHYATWYLLIQLIVSVFQPILIFTFFMFADSYGYWKVWQYFGEPYGVAP